MCVVYVCFIFAPFVSCFALFPVWLVLCKYTHHGGCRVDEEEDPEAVGGGGQRMTECGCQDSLIQLRCSK